jgi:hypothetical protein
MLKRVAGVMFAAGALLMAQGPAKMARPGTVNYAEGQVTLNGESIGSPEMGKAEAAPGQVLETQAGKAEMLLTPGVFVRLGDHSALRLVSPSLTDTRVELLRGEAMVEADQVEKENHIAVLDSGAMSVIEKHGIYEFRADQPMVAVYDGKLQVQRDDHTVKLGKGKELLLAQEKPQKFDRDAAESNDPLYAWSKLRSEYVADANMSTAQTFAYGGVPWYGMGWYWNPYFSSWAFLPGDGFLYSPFGYGWGFYSPGYWRTYAPYYGYGYGYPGIHRGFGGYRGGIVGRGFAGRSMPAAPRAGGFHGRMGGFGGGHMGGFAGGGHMGGARMGGGRR